MSITAEKLRTATFAVQRAKVELPELGVGEDGEPEYCWVHGMTALEKTRHDAEAMNKSWSGIVVGKALTMKERLILKCMRDDNGAQLLGNGDADQVARDIELLQSWPAATVNRIFNAANDLCGGNDEKK